MVCCFKCCWLQKPEATVQIMADYLQMARCQQPDCMNADGYRMTFIVYKNAKLFPILNASADDNEVSTPVIAGKIGL